MSSVLIPNETKKKVVIKKKIIKKVKKRKDNEDNENEEHNDTNNDEVIEAPLVVKEEKEEAKKKKKIIVKKVIKKKKEESQQGSNMPTEENGSSQIILPPIEQNKNINNSNNDSDIKEQKEKEKNHIEVQVDSPPKEDVIEEDSKKVKEMKEKIERINKQRKYESENFPQETLEYDIKISNYNESINDITAKNNVLFAQLTKLQKRINLIFDINIKKSMKKESTTSSNEKAEPTIEELNAMKDKQKESMNKLIEVFKKDIVKLKSQLESSEDYAQRIEQLEHTLSEKKTKIEKLQNSIAVLSKVKDIHIKSCTKVHERLVEKLTAVKNEHLFIKESIYKEEQLKKRNEEIKSKPKNKRRTVSLIHNRIEKTLSNTTIDNQPVFYNEFSKIQTKIQKMNMHKKNKSYSERITLFNSDEQTILEKLIPNEVIKKFNTRFMSIDKERSMLEKKLLLEKKSKKVKNSALALKFFNNKEQLAKSQHFGTSLMIEVKSNEREKEKLSKTIKEYTKKMNGIIKDYLSKEKENKELLEKIELLSKQNEQKENVDQSQNVTEQQ